VGLTVDAYDRNDQNLVATGVVEAVDNQVDPTTGTFKVKATFANKDNALFPNQFVNAHLLASIQKNLILVPTAAVQHGPDGGAFVYVVGTGPAVAIRNVKEGPGEGDFTSVTGVRPGDVVVTDGTDKLQDGTKVTVSMAQSTGPTTRSSRRREGATQESTTQESP
jgi:multidrug efflux system membrane fusion protein